MDEKTKWNKILSAHGLGVYRGRSDTKFVRVVDPHKMSYFMDEGIGEFKADPFKSRERFYENLNI